MSKKIRERSRYLRRKKAFLKLMRLITPDQSLTCAYCGRKNLFVGKKKNRPEERRASVDHFLPKCREDIDSANMANFVVACKGCNNEKGERDGEELVAWVREICAKRRETVVYV